MLNSITNEKLIFLSIIFLFLIRFSFGLSDEFYFVDDNPTIFTFKVNYIDLKSGGEDYDEYEREIELCQQDHFKKFPGAFDKLVLNKTNCLKNGSMYLKGFWNDEQSYYMSVKLVKCVNSTDSDIVCRSEEEISKYFDDKYFNIFYQQNNFDLSNFLQPITSKIKTFFSGLEYGRKKEMRLFLKKTIIHSDYQVIFAKEDIVNSYSFDRIEYDTIGSENTLFEVQIYSSEIKSILKRRYEKLFELMALLGGITNSLTVIFTFIIKILYDWNINELIMNSLFAIKIVPKVKQDNRTSKLIKVSPKDNKLVEEMKLSLGEKIVMFMKRKKKRTAKETLYLDYIRKSDGKIDLIEVLKKIEEIDRLKLILLNEDQTKLFDSMSRQSVFIVGNTQRLRGTKYYFDTKVLNLKERLTTATFIEKIKNDPQSNEVDKRLINLIE